MTSTNRILIIGGRREALEALQKANSFGLDVLYIQEKDQFKAEMLALVSQLVLMDFQDLPALMSIANGLYNAFPFACAISLSEDGLVPAAHVNEALKLGYNSLETVLTIKDKSRMREKLNASGLSRVEALVGRGFDDAAAFGSMNSYPIILKPIDGSGSSAIFKINSAAHLEEIWTRIAAEKLTCFLLEEFLAGPEVSIESFSFHGRHLVIAITDKVTNSSHVEIGHSLPAQLSNSTFESVVQLTHEFLDLIGLRDGPSHTEMKLTPRGPRIIETHNRTGGDRINELVRVAYGVDMKKMALGWPCNRIHEIQQPLGCRAGAAIRFLTPNPGTVVEISGINEASMMDGLEELDIRVTVGDTIGFAVSSFGRSGHIIVSGASVAEAIHRCEKIVQKIVIRTT